ncbi:MAG: lysoplasmalogenase family protein [Acholeplasma sp.]|nr:lysoplasmalogenase family protein [Acholeplasma sp.]
MMYGLLVLFLIILVTFMYFVILKNRIIGFYLKGLSSLSFVFIYGYGVYNFFIKNDGLDLTLSNNKFIYFILFIGLGLICGLLGDLFLEVQYFYEEKKHVQILYGMAAFFIGHVFYILAISALIGFNLISILVGLVFTLLIAVGGEVLKMDFGILRFPSYLYTFIIFTMVGQAFFLAYSNNFNSFSLILMIGAILFGVSDLILAPIYFKNEKRVTFSILNLSAYYIAQMLIAISIMFLV